MSLTQSIKEYALDLGYCSVGVAPAEPYHEFIEAVTTRKNQYHFLTGRPTQPAVNADPHKAAPNARSVISVAYSYMTHSFPEHLLQYVGRAYLGRCYEPSADRINGSRFKLLRDYVTKLGCTIQTGVFVPERWAAAKGGATTFGRNNFAYARGAGSFIILSSIVVDTELEYSEPATKIPCPPGCTACMDACPAKAIYEPNKLNPQRCLSYNAWITREGMPGETGYIEPDMRELMGTRVHGCDYCQEACPRNRAKLKETRPADPFLELIAKDFSLEQLFEMSGGFYETRVQPIMYNYLKEKKYFQRNAAIAMGNTGDPKYIPLLEKALRTDSEEMVRGYAAWALGRFGDTTCRAALEKAGKTDPSVFVATEIAAALAK